MDTATVIVTLLAWPCCRSAPSFHIRASDRVADMVPAVIGIALAATTAVLHTV